MRFLLSFRIESFCPLPDTAAGRVSRHRGTRQ
nr:MAG TPA: hypothetical protein [Caudoviricetes sp.]